MTEMRVQHQRTYRRSVMNRAKGRRLVGMLYLAAAATFWPPALIYQLRRRLAAVFH